MSKYDGFIGREIGKFRIIDLIVKKQKNGKNRSYFQVECLCCNDEMEIRADSIISGTTTVCSLSKTKELRGKKFPSSTVIGKDIRYQDKKHFIDCLCDCGNLFYANVSLVKTAKNLNCGCDPGIHARTHGKTNTRTYRIWRGMKNRCYNPRVKDFARYGARGIQICDRWLNSFEKFLEDMGECPSNRHTIERKDVNGNYEQSNCVWLIDIEQQRNRTDTKWIEINGIKKCQIEWAEIMGVSDYSIGNWLKKGILEQKYLEFLAS